MTVVTPETDVLAGLSREDFQKVVDDDIRRVGTDEAHDALRSPAHILRWHDTLSAIIKSVEGQLASKNADSVADQMELRLAGKDQEAEQEAIHNQHWRGGAIRFKTGVEQNLFECRQLMREFEMSEYSKAREERDRALSRIAVLEEAIRRHQKTVVKEIEGDDITDADKELWEYLHHAD